MRSLDRLRSAEEEPGIGIDIDTSVGESISRGSRPRARSHRRLLDRPTATGGSWSGS